jgi:hypothetical protein
VRAPSPNPPGDTRAAAAVLARWMEARGCPSSYSCSFPKPLRAAGRRCPHTGPHIPPSAGFKARRERAGGAEEGR